MAARASSRACIARYSPIAAEVTTCRWALENAWPQVSARLAHPACWALRARRSQRYHPQPAQRGFVARHLLIENTVSPALGRPCEQPVAARCLTRTVRESHRQHGPIISQAADICSPVSAGRTRTRTRCRTHMRTWGVSFVPQPRHTGAINPFRRSQFQ
jgi:hypothetical protein